MLLYAMLFYVGRVLEAPALYWCFWGASIALEIVKLILIILQRRE